MNERGGVTGNGGGDEIYFVVYVTFQSILRLLNVKTQIIYFFETLIYGLGLPNAPTPLGTCS